MKSLLDRYGLPDPLAGLPGGSFSTPGFQSLHDDLVALSSRSLVDALKVGLQIEELDIRDIEGQKAAIDNDDILLVYDRRQAQFDAILAMPDETGP